MVSLVGYVTEIDEKNEMAYSILQFENTKDDNEYESMIELSKFDVPPVEGTYIRVHFDDETHEMTIESNIYGVWTEENIKRAEREANRLFKFFNRID